MDFIPDSDDEYPAAGPAKRRTNLEYQDAGIDKVSSDDDDEIWSVASLPVPAQATPQCHAPIGATTNRFASNRRPTLTGAIKPRAQYQGRRLVSSAVTARQASAATVDAGTEPLDDPLQGESIAFQSSGSRHAAPRFPSRAGPAFVGRPPPMPLKPMPEPAQPSAKETTRNAPSSQLYSQPAASSGATAPARNPAPIRSQQPFASQPTSRSSAPEGPDVTTHKTDEGLNVIFNRRKRSAEGYEAGPSSKRASVNTGWGNNFVRIDLKKGRGSTKFKASRHSTSSRRRPGRGRWKTQRLRQVGDGAEFMEGWESRGGSTCFKCGGKGHWAKDCPGVEQFGDAGVETDSDEDLAQNRKKTSLPSLPPLPSLPQEAASPPAAPVELPDLDIEALCEAEALEAHLQRVFGFSAFRGLQLDTIRKVLRGEPCLSIMPTGMGKSLCYQLPALLLPGLTLVVSPLIALMHDQCRAAPKELNPAVLWSGQTPVEARQVLKDVETGLTRLLFISPERLGNPYLLASLRPRMPLSLVVIDEAHCVAEWGHSFRPAYFRIGEILQRDVSTRSILALTATATKATEAAVCGVLRIPQTQVLRDSTIRQNLRLHVVRSQGTPCSGIISCSWQQVTGLFKGGPLSDSRSAVVYCAWKGDADSLAAALVRSGVGAKSYHAGRNLQERGNIEKAFATGRLRVVVATVAFGMGIDIARVDAVVHATMPRSLEEYVQQIGRAGRDGSVGRCYAHLADQDFISLRSLAYSGLVTKESIHTLLSHVFSSVEDSSSQEEEEAESKRRFGALYCRKLAAELDMQEESIEAVLGYLEADEAPYLRVLPKGALSVKVSFYSTPAEEMAEEHAVVRAVLEVCPKPRNGLYTVQTTKLADAAQKPPGAVLQELQALAQQSRIGFELSRELGPAIEILREVPDIDELADSVHARLSTMLRCQVARLDTAYRSFASAVASSDQQRQEFILREALEEYFASQDAAGMTGGGGVVDPCAPLDLEDLPLRNAPESMLQAAKAALRRNGEQGGPEISPMVLARVLHGTGSPGTPRDVWMKRMGAFWGTMKNVDFTAVVRVCTLACKSCQ